MNTTLEFSISGFPKIILKDDGFQVHRTPKSGTPIDFFYNEIEELEYARGNADKNYILKLILSPFWYKPNFFLTIKKTNQEVWKFECSEYYHPEFADFTLRIVTNAGLLRE